MIEMDVTKKHMADVSWLEADLSQLANNSLERRFRPSVEENQATIGFQCCDRDDIRPTKVVGIEYVNFLRIRCFKIDGALASGDQHCASLSAHRAAARSARRRADGR